MANPPLLEMDRDALAFAPIGFGDDDVCLVTFVGGGKQSHAGLPTPTQRGGDIGEPVSGVEHLGADQMRRKVAVAESEPVGICAVGGQFLLGVPRLVGSTPTALRVDSAAERVHTGVEIGTDAHAVHPCVVTDVDHRGDLVSAARRRVARGVGKRRRTEQFANSGQKSCAADTADEYRHLHNDPL